MALRRPTNGTVSDVVLGIKRRIKFNEDEPRHVNKWTYEVISLSKSRVYRNETYTEGKYVYQLSQIKVLLIYYFIMFRDFKTANHVDCI